MRDSVKRVSSIIVIAAMLLGMSFGGAVFAADVHDISISVSQDDLLDVVLTLGQTDSEVSDVQEDLEAALTARGVPADKIKITAVESSAVSAGNTTSGWETYDHTNYNDSSVIPYYRPYYAEGNGNYTLTQHISPVVDGDTADIDFYGYGAPGYKDFMYMPNTQYGKKIFDFTIQEGEFYDALNGAGFLFNTSMTSNTNLASRTMSGYLIFFRYPGSAPPPTVEIYRFSNVDVNAFHNSAGTNIESYSGFTRIASKTVGSERTRGGKIEATSTSIKMWYNGGLIDWSLDAGGHAAEVTLPSDFGAYGFGPLVGYLSHGCAQHTHFTFFDVKMTTESTKRFSEVIREPEWRGESKRFIINAEDGAVADFSNDKALGEILSRLGNENIHYIGWGRNDSDGNAFITKNDGKGTFVDKDVTATDTYAEQIAAIADYIYNEYSEDVDPDAEYLIYGKPSALAISPDSEKTNTADENWPNGKWKVVQSQIYDNSTGTVPYHNMYLNNLDISFSEAGKYDIYYQDTLVKTVYVHRKPVAGFSLSTASDGSGGYTVSITDNAYDPDFENAPGKGIASETWQYRETNSSTWISGQPSSFAANKNYIVRQVVTDGYNVESDPYYRYVSTEATTDSVPVAEFKVSPSKLLTYITEDVAYDDTSYDPQGKTITARAWTVSKDGAQIYPVSGTAATPLENFADAGSGTYKITLKVRNASNVWSEEVARYLTVVRDATAPTAASNTPDGGNYNEPKTVQLTFDDEEGGSGFSHRFAVVTSTTATPAEWGSMGTNNVYSVTLHNLGANYIHYQARDYANNVKTGYFGPFTLTDTSAPSTPAIAVTPAYTDGTWAKGDLTLTASGSTDDFTAGASLIYEVSDDDTDYSSGNVRTLAGETGTFTVHFKVSDVSGNSTVASKTVKLDNTAPSTPEISMSTSSGDYTGGTWSAQNVSVTLSGATDAHSGFAGYQYKIDDGTWQDGSAYTFNVSGVHTLHYRSVDNAGNVSAEGSELIKVDLEAPGEPTVEISPGYTTDWTNKTVTLTASLSDDNLTEGDNIIYEVSEDGTAFSDGDSLTFSDEGTHTGWFRVTDESGNTTTVSRTVKIDKTAPAKPDIAMVSSAKAYTEGTWATSSVEITLSGSADAASGLNGYQYKVGSGEWKNGSTYMFSASGVYTIYYRALDGAGNISESGSKVVKVDVDAPKPFAITASSTTIDSINISASTTDAESGMAAYRIFNGTSWSDWKTAVNETLGGYARGQLVTIKVEALDTAGNVRSAEVTLSTMQNTAPVCAEDAFTMKEDAAKTALSVLSNDTDADTGRADSDALSVTSVSPLSKLTAGRLSLEAGVITFTPASNFNGTVSFMYSAADSKGAVSTAPVTITVTAVNDAPTASADSASTDEDKEVMINVLANDNDVDSSLSIGSVGNASNGTVAKAGSSLKYTPAANFNGSDSFTYTVTDGQYDSTATVQITVKSVNDAPSASADSADTYYMQAVSIDALANDSDIDGDKLSITAASAPAHGKAAVQNNKLTYTPADGFTGTDTFSYTMTDGKVKADAAVTVKVAYPEFAGDNTAVFSPGNSNQGSGNGENTGTGANDTGGSTTGLADGEMRIASQPSGGTVTMAGGSAYYTPGAGTSGIDTYRVILDTENGQVEYQVITNTSAETGETTTLGYGVPLSDEGFTSQGNEIRIPLAEYLGENFDENAQITIDGQPLNGNVRIENGYLVYSPSEGFSGLDAVVFIISVGDEQVPYAATFNVESGQPLVSIWCVIGWVVAAVLLTLNYLRHRDYFREKKARTILYIVISVLACLILCWLRNYVGYYVSAAIMAAYIAAAWLYTGYKQRRYKSRKIIL